MSDRAAWFVYGQPHAGKFNARPIHPIGWALVFGLPLPGLIGGGAIADLTGNRLAGLVGALAITGIGIWQLFRLIRRRGVGEAAGD